jgi:hypothetical protein
LVSLKNRNSSSETEKKLALPKVMEVIVIVANMMVVLLHATVPSTPPIIVVM